MARRNQIHRDLLGGSLVLTLAMVAAWPALAQPGDAQRWSRVPQIEIKAPSAFGEGARHPSRQHRVRYRVDATVLFPLFSIPLAHRDDVGFASTIIQDFPDSSGAGLLAPFSLLRAYLSSHGRPGWHRTRTSLRNDRP